MIHTIEIEEDCFENIRRGIKKSDIRLNDKDYQKGDFLRFEVQEAYDLVTYRFQITHIHSGLGLEKNYVSLSIKLVEE